MDKYRISNVIFEGKCYKTSAILDAELSYVDCIEDLVVDKFFLDNPYYGEFLEAMKERMNNTCTNYNSDKFTIKYNPDSYDCKIMSIGHNGIGSYFHSKMKYYNHDIQFITAIYECERFRSKHGKHALIKLLQEMR